MVAVPSTTGSNTSATRQAAIKVQLGGCITEALKAALESQLVIEFPDALGGTGDIDVLSSTAVKQIAVQLLAETEFQTLLATTLATDPTLASIVTSILESTDFEDQLTSTVDERLTTTEVTDQIATLLLANETFTTGLITVILGADSFVKAINDSVLAYLGSLDIVSCATVTYTVVQNNVINIPISGQIDNDYWFDYHVIEFTSNNAGTNSNASKIINLTPSQVTISFPQALPNDTVTLYHLTLSCRI